MLPMVNKGLALFQSKQDAGSAIKLCEEALTIDPENEAAVATLAQLNLQQGNIVEALKMFNRHCELARTEPELQNALTYKYVSRAATLILPDLTLVFRRRRRHSYSSCAVIRRWRPRWVIWHSQ